MWKWTMDVDTNTNANFPINKSHNVWIWSMNVELNVYAEIIEEMVQMLSCEEMFCKKRKHVGKNVTRTCEREIWR